MKWSAKRGNKEGHYLPGGAGIDSPHFSRPKTPDLAGNGGAAAAGGGEPLGLGLGLEEEERRGRKEKAGAWA